MAYLRKLMRKYERDMWAQRKYRYKGKIQKHGFYLPFSTFNMMLNFAEKQKNSKQFIEKSIKELKKHAPKRERLIYNYWVIEESYRNKDKVKSRVLFNLGQLKRKPTKKQIRKILLDMMYWEYALQEVWIKEQRFETLNLLHELNKEVRKLQHAYNKLNDRRWKKGGD